MVLDQGPTPLYHQLKNILKSRIFSNELKGNQRLQTEAELCIEFNVSRITVRQALSELMKDGLIYRDRGRGTFVTEDKEIPLEPGVCIYNPPGKSHKILNTGDEVLRFVWIYSPQLPSHRK